MVYERDINKSKSKSSQFKSVNVRGRNFPRSLSDLMKNTGFAAQGDVIGKNYLTCSSSRAIFVKNTHIVRVWSVCS